MPKRSLELWVCLATWYTPWNWRLGLILVHVISINSLYFPRSTHFADLKTLFHKLFISLKMIAHRHMRFWRGFYSCKTYAEEARDLQLVPVVFSALIPVTVKAGTSITGSFDKVFNFILNNWSLYGKLTIINVKKDIERNIFSYCFYSILAPSLKADWTKQWARVKL